MTSIAILFVFAGVLGFLGAVLGVRNLKRQTEITIERGIPRSKFPVIAADDSNTL